MKNYYTILEITESASSETIRNAYRLLAKKWHPDLNPGNKEAEKTFLDIQEAYNTLSNTLKRNYYDYQFRRFILLNKTQATTENSSPADTKNKTEKKQKDASFFSVESYQQKLDILMKKHQDILEKQKKTAQFYREKEEKPKSFYDTFRENRENSMFQKNKEETDSKDNASVQDAIVNKASKKRIRSILSILGFNSD